MQKKLSNIIRKAAFFMIPIASAICYAGISDDVYASSETTEDSLIYNFRDAKKEGTITFVKRWKDGKKEEDRNIPNIEISTKKPRKNVSGYTVIFHGNGMTFADGSTENEMLFNSSMNIIGGQYKVPGEAYAFWYTEPECINKVNVSSTGIPDLQLDGDINLYARAVTFVTKTGTEFNNAIPDNMTSVIFTDEEMPDGAEIINVDEDNDGGVVAWTEGNIMKVSTQIEGIPIQFNSDCEVMFGNKSNLNSIEFDNIDTSKVEEMGNMFKSCSSIANLDLSSFCLVIFEVVDTFFVLRASFSITLFAVRFVRLIYAIFTPGTPRNILTILIIHVCSISVNHQPMPASRQHRCAGHHRRRQCHPGGHFLKHTSVSHFIPPSEYYDLKLICRISTQKQHKKKEAKLNSASFFYIDGEAPWTRSAFFLNIRIIPVITVTVK